MVLRSLVHAHVDLTAIVSMADDGGSTGKLRDELGVHPAGDVRQCLLALSEADESLKSLFSYRFPEGALKGHNAGNILLAALEGEYGSFETAVEVASKMLEVKGKILPVTLDDVRLSVVHGETGEKVVGEHVIDDGLILRFPRKFALEPSGNINPKAREAILAADLVVIGPGSLATSLIPVLLVNGMKETLQETKAKIVYNVNLVTTPGQTDGYSVIDYVKEIEAYIGRACDAVTYNIGTPSAHLVNALPQGSTFVPVGDFDKDSDRQYVGADFLHDLGSQTAGDMIKRNVFTHDPKKLAEVLLSL